MHPIQTFDFETQALRTMMQDDQFWFVAADVCRILQHSNVTMALEALDDDEKAKLNLGLAGGATNIINESGLYTLILRSRDATTAGTPAHRFRKWVTSEVLPSIRKTGVFLGGEDDDALPSLGDGRLWGQPVAKVNAAARMIGVVRAIYGPEAARHLYEKEKGLPSLRRLSVIALEENPASDPAGAFRHLMRAAAGNGTTIGALLDLALRDKIAAKRLAEYGIKVTRPGGDVAFANAHPFLASVFVATAWAREWRLAFALLPGARCAKEQVTFNDVKARATLVPSAEVLKLRNPLH